MDVSEAVQRRMSVRAFKPEAPSAAVVRAILEGAARAPSGGNLQPWHVHALTGEPLTQLLRAVESAPLQEEPEYAVYPPDLWEPYRTRRFRNAEQLYASIGIPREDKMARLQWFAIKLYVSCDAPLVLFANAVCKCRASGEADSCKYQG